MEKQRYQLQDPARELSQFQFRVRLLLLLILLMLGILLGRMAYLQVFQYDQHVSRSERNRMAVEAIPPTRGLIYDREGRLLADNLPSHSLMLTRELTGDPSLVIQRLCVILALAGDCETLLETRSRQRRRPFEPALLVDQLSDEQIALLAVNRHLLPGVEVAAQLLRHYPLADSLAHVLGYVGRISDDDLEAADRSLYGGLHYIGKTGIERYYEDLLRGQAGYRRVETNARGRVIRVIETHSPVPGTDLHLYLDAALQQTAYQVLEGNRGALVAIEPATGGILALVSSPGFDPNLFIGSLDPARFNRLLNDPDQPMFDRASRGQYAPGSTIKPFVGLAGLELGVVDEETRLVDPGYYQLPNDDRLYRNWRRGGHGEVDLRRSLAVSNNTFFYDLAYNLGIDRMSSFLQQFGFGQVTALDVQGARSGLLPTRDWKNRVHRQPWFPGETLSAGIGQGYWLTTPLQLATATSVLANRGHWVMPRLLQHTEQHQPVMTDAVQVQDIQPQNLAHWDYILRGMQDVMHSHEGTARAAGQQARYRIAGKTGTSQVFSLSQTDEERPRADLPEHLRNHAVFMGFAPADRPAIALAIIIENAAGGGGSAVAAPIARQVFDAYLTPERLESIYAP